MDINSQAQWATLRALQHTHPAPLGLTEVAEWRGIARRSAWKATRALLASGHIKVAVPSTSGPHGTEQRYSLTVLGSIVVGL